MIKTKESDRTFSPNQTVIRTNKTKSDGFTYGTANLATFANQTTSFNNTTESNNNNGEVEKKDAAPLLIIDVNIRPGVKKKIYVMEGDSAEGLAEKFSAEHSKEIS